MCLSGRVGAEIDVPRDAEESIWLYSESNTRWIVEIKESSAKEFEGIMGGDARMIGRTGGDFLAIAGARIPVSGLYESWSRPLWNVMGGAA
jgi:phosphoribosylformylglycinamidine synthase